MLTRAVVTRYFASAGRYLAETIGGVAAGAIVIYTMVFFAMAVLPVDPARAILGPFASAPAVEQLRAELGLNRPLPERYFRSVFSMLRGKLALHEAQEA
jgi:peptide/nickel transport system permease protein